MPYLYLPRDIGCQRTRLSLLLQENLLPSIASCIGTSVSASSTRMPVPPPSLLFFRAYVLPSLVLAALAWLHHFLFHSHNLMHFRRKQKQASCIQSSVFSRKYSLSFSKWGLMLLDKWFTKGWLREEEKMDCMRFFRLLSLPPPGTRSSIVSYHIAPLLPHTLMTSSLQGRHFCMLTG